MKTRTQSSADANRTFTHKDEDLWFKVECVDAMSRFLLDARDTFFDFPDFVGLVKRLWKQRQELMEPHPSATEQEKSKSIEQAMGLEDRLDAAFDCFEIGYRQRLVGSYSELFTATRTEIAFPGGITHIIKAADYVCGKTLARLNVKWEGFSIFSVVKDEAAVSAAVVVFKHSYSRRADFVLDWLISAHEVGHIYHSRVRDLIEAPESNEVVRSLFLPELVADAFCFEHGYVGEAEMFLLDLVYSYSYDVPIRFRSADDLRYFVFRLFGAWLYVEMRRRDTVLDKLTAVLRAYSNASSRRRSPSSRSISSLRTLANEFIDFLEQEQGTPPLGQYVAAIVIRELRNDLLTGPDWRVRTIYLLMAGVWEIYSVSFGGDEKGPQELKVPPKPSFDENACLEMANRVIRGEVVGQLIEDPYAFLRTLRKVCAQLKVDLEEPGENQQIRAAAILSLSNSYELTTGR
jgi:hypothetical protein